MRKHVRRFILALAVITGILLIGPAWMMVSGQVDFDGDWRTADMSSTYTAPDPEFHRDAIVQVYAARAFNWRAAFAVHTWIAIKRKDAEAYEVHEVIGWRAMQNLPVVVNHRRAPDGLWFDAEPELLVDIRGSDAEALIDKIMVAIDSYPYPNSYTMWPGPNSNTFTAFVGRAVPELHLDLPSTAIGKDFIPDAIFGTAPSGTGYQLSLAGVIGLLASPEEGLELNVMSLSLGIDFLEPALRLPGVGRLELP